MFNFSSLYTKTAFLGGIRIFPARANGEVENKDDSLRERSWSCVCTRLQRIPLADKQRIQGQAYRIRIMMRRQTGVYIGC